MAKQETSRRTWSRLFFFLAAAAAGFVHLMLRAPAGDSRSVVYVYNAFGFFLAYPALYLYRWIPFPAFLRMLFYPLSFVLELALVVTSYLWTAYAFQAAGSPHSDLFFEHFLVLGGLFFLVYASFGRAVLGVSRDYCPVPVVVGLLLYGALGAGAALLAGGVVKGRLEGWFHEPDVRLLAWITLVTAGALLGFGFAPEAEGRRAAEARRKDRKEEE